MNLRRVSAVARKEVLHVVRDYRSLLMALATPAFLLTLFGYALTLDVDDVPMVVWDQSQTARSRELISRFASSHGNGPRYFSIRGYVSRYADVEKAIDRREAMMGLVVPRDFAQRIDAGRDAPVQLIVDGSDSNTATIAIGYADVVTQIYALDLTIEQNQRRGMPPLAIPLDVRPRVWFNEDLESRNFIIPGLIAVIMMVIAAMLTSLTIAREWERGTMEQLISTPVKPGELILGKLVPYFAIGMCDVLIAVLMSEFVFHVPLRGNVALLFGMSAIFLTGALAMGLLVSIVTKSQLLSSQVAVLTTFLPGFLLSGFIFTIANMPQAIRMVTYLISARYFVTILKGIYLKGVGLEILATEALFLIFYAAVMVVLARVKLKKKLT
ncbi:MAG: ABC transporter permease [Planctomycetaceae bacterium]|nr:ABC transporter permease [Planctomycetaceae bacterium]